MSAADGLSCGGKALFPAAVIFTGLQVLAARKNFYSREYGRLTENILLCAAVDLLMALNPRFPHPFSPFVLVCLAASVTGTAFPSGSRGFSCRSAAYGRVLHLFRCFSFALFLYGVFLNLFGPVHPGGYLPAVVVTAGIASGTVFELFEFVTDSRPKKRLIPQRRRGPEDTEYGLLFDTVGALLAGIAARFLFL